MDPETKQSELEQQQQQQTSEPELEQQQQQQTSEPELEQQQMKELEQRAMAESHAWRRQCVLDARQRYCQWVERMERGQRVESGRVVNWSGSIDQLHLRPARITKPPQLKQAEP